MTFINSRLVVSLFIFLVSLGAAYGTLQPLTHDSASDPSQKLHADLNHAFARHWKARTGAGVSIRQAQSKSGKPVHAAIDGLDITALALSYDRNTPGEKIRFIPPEWKLLPQSLPYASPYISTIVFLVRKGNPKGLTDWDDLLRPGVEIIASSPESTEEGRWSYLAAWGYALKQPGSDEADALEFVKNLFANIRPLDSEPGKKGAIIDFVERGTGDVLLAWENEAHHLAREKGADKFEIIVPSVSIAAERPISVVASGSVARDVAAAYIDYLYSHPAQDIAARHYFRPRNALTNAKYGAQFPSIELFTIDDVFGGWQKAQKTHFSKGGLFEQIQSH